MLVPGSRKVPSRAPAGARPVRSPRSRNARKHRVHRKGECDAGRHAHRRALEWPEASSKPPAIARHPRSSVEALKRPFDSPDQPSTPFCTTATTALRCHGPSMDITSGSRASKTYGGSRKRIRQIKMRDNGSWEIWLLVAWLVFLVLVVLPWMIRHSQ